MYTKSTFATHANTAAPVAHHHQQRSNTNRAAANSTSTSTSAAAAPRGAAHGQYTSVYAPGFKYVLNLPQHAIHHLPPASLNVTRLVLCANYDAKAPETSCPMGDRCKFVHADTAAAHEHCIHVNYAWRSLDLVSYERFPAGQVLHVAPPNSKVGSDVMDSDMALKTKALQSTRRPLSHCAHYYFNRTCNLGAECQFVHAVFIDPAAKDHQRAPVPSELGRDHRTSRMASPTQPITPPYDPFTRFAARPKFHHEDPWASPASPPLPLPPPTAPARRGGGQGQLVPLHTTANFRYGAALADLLGEPSHAVVPFTPKSLTGFSAYGFDDLVGSPSTPSETRSEYGGDTDRSSLRGDYDDASDDASSISDPLAMMRERGCMRYRHNPYPARDECVFKCCLRAEAQQ